MDGVLRTDSRYSCDSTTSLDLHWHIIITWTNVPVIQQSLLKHCLVVGQRPYQRPCSEAAGPTRPFAIAIGIIMGVMITLLPKGGFVLWLPSEETLKPLNEKVDRAGP